MNEIKEIMKSKEQIRIPVDLEETMQKGMSRGREEKMKRQRRNRSRWNAVACFIMMMGIFGVGVNVSPVFADSIKDVPVLGTLVQVFQINKDKVTGGTEGHAKGEIFLEREATKERLIIDFAKGENANKYEAVYEKKPQSITISLPGTTDVTLLSDFKRADGESDFIKSVYPLITLDDSLTRYVVEIEDLSNVQISEYKNPGQIVIELTHTEKFDLNETYSVRSYSYENNEAFATLEETLQGTHYRILKDDQGHRFFEFAQFDNQEEAFRFAETIKSMDTLVEGRYGNNVPVCFQNQKDYKEYLFGVKYNAFLQKVMTVDEILQFIDENKQENPESLPLMLDGLTGMIRAVDESTYDLNQVNRYYALIGTTLAKELDNIRR